MVTAEYLRRNTDAVEVTAAVIQRSDGAYLLDQRKEGSFREFYFEFPGGKREPTDESLEECLRRELKEELDIDVVVREEVVSVRHKYKGRDPMVLHAFLCDIVDGTPKGIEGNKIGWYHLNEIPRLNLVEADRVILAELLKRFCS